MDALLSLLVSPTNMRGSLHKRLQGVCFSFPFKSMKKNPFLQNDMLIISLEDIRSVKKNKKLLNIYSYIDRTNATEISTHYIVVYVSIQPIIDKYMVMARITSAVFIC